MSTRRARQVYLRPELLYFGPDRIHLASNSEHELTPADALLLELIYRGCSELDNLEEAVRSLAAPGSGAEVAAHLQAVLQDPRSVLELRDAPPVAKPDVIICDFTESDAAIDGGRLARALKRSKSVVHLGLDDRIKGDTTRNISLETARTSGHITNWFEFLQWCRGFIGAHSDANLILCGQQDAILFGDLTRHVPSLVVASPTWPPAITPVDLHGSDLPGDDSFDATRALYYAMQCSGVDDWGSVRREHSSDLALLEITALRHAKTVFYSEVDQLDPLLALGRTSETTRFCHRVRPDKRSGKRAEGLRYVLIAGDTVDHGRPLFRFLHLLLQPTSKAPNDVQLIVATPRGWLRPELADDGKMSLRQYVGPAPIPNCIGAIALTGLIRHPQQTFEIMAHGVPTVFVPSTRQHPLMDGLPHDRKLDVASAESLADLITRWHDEDEPDPVDTANAQRAFVRRLDVVDRIRATLAETLATGASNG